MQGRDERKPLLKEGVSGKNYTRERLLPTGIIAPKGGMNMYGMDEMQEMNLSVLGDLERTVQTEIPKLIKSLNGDYSAKASLAITITLNLTSGTQTGIDIKTAVKPTFPSKKQKIQGRLNLITGVVLIDPDDIPQKELFIKSQKEVEA